MIKKPYRSNVLRDFPWMWAINARWGYGERIYVDPFRLTSLESMKPPLDNSMRKRLYWGLYVSETSNATEVVQFTAEGPLLGQILNHPLAKAGYRIQFLVAHYWNWNQPAHRYAYQILRTQSLTTDLHGELLDYRAEYGEKLEEHVT